MCSITFQQRYHQTYTELTSACHCCVDPFSDHDISADLLYMIMQNEPGADHDCIDVNTE